MKNKTIIIAGNHHTPAIELIRQLKEDRKFNWDVYYISNKNPGDTHIQNTIIPLIGTDHYFDIKSTKYHRFSLLKTFLNLHLIFFSIKKIFIILKNIKPNIVVSFGGYISVPVVISSKVLTIPSITHEQTSTFSLSTKINSFFCNIVALSFPSESKKHKYKHTGNLLRREIYDTNSPSYSHLTSKLKKYPLIFISGGNQGAHKINQVAEELILKLSKKYTLIHHTGNLDFPHFSSKFSNIKNYYPTSYVSSNDIGWVLNYSSLIINRAGANYCQEINQLSKKSIIIPLPYSQQNEQSKNAHWLKNQLPDQTMILDDSNLNSKTLSQAIDFQFSKINNLPPKSMFINDKLLDLIHQQI